MSIAIGGHGFPGAERGGIEGGGNIGGLIPKPLQEKLKRTVGGVRKKGRQLKEAAVAAWVKRARRRFRGTS